MGGDFWAFTGCGVQRGCGPPSRPATLKLRRGRLARYGVTTSAFYGAAPPKKNQLGSPKGWSIGDSNLAHSQGEFTRIKALS